MNLKTIVIFSVLSTFLFPNFSSGQGLVINEIGASNSSIIFDEDGSSSDWIELYNWSDSPVDLSGFGLSNKKSKPDKWIFPSVLIPAKSYLIVFASDKDRMTTPLHTNFKVSASGEFLSLSDAEGIIIDSIQTPPMGTDISFGRIPDGTKNWAVLSEPTPGEENNNSLFLPPCQIPVISQPGGYYTGKARLEITSTDTNAKIYYSLDGSEPDSTSTLYTQPVELTETKVLRARSFVHGASPSEIATETYVINEKFSFPVVSVTTDPYNLWDKKYGIYVDDGGYPNCNSFQDWERPVNIEYIEKSGEIGFKLDGGVKIHGGLTRIVNQKALNIYARKRYGEEFIDYKLFDDKEIDQFKTLVLRNGGNDYKFGIFRDPMMMTLVKGQMGLETPAFNYVIHLLNGEYWGIECIQEKFDEYYVAANNNLDADSINLIEYQAFTPLPVPKKGTADEFNSLMEFVDKNDLSVKENYDYVASKIDIENYINYIITEIYIDNGDWPGNNVRIWNSTEAGSKWRWLLCDLDFGYGLSPFGYVEDHTNHNTLAVATQPDFDKNWPNPPYSTLLLRSLCNNEEFSTKFINNACDHLNTTFQPERANDIIDSFETLLSPEMDRHKKRFPESAPKWSKEINVMRDFANKRATNVFYHVMAKFKLQRPKTLTFDADSAKGEIQLNTLLLTGFPWSGKYFPNVPSTITALPKPGHTFKSWSDGDTAQTRIINPNTASQYTAFFDNDGSTLATQFDENSSNLKQNYPNPFRSQTTINYQLAETSPVQIRVIDFTGRTVKILVDETQTAGNYSLEWNGENQNGQEVKADIYFLQMVSGRISETKKMIKME
jgi:hypothetical protein